MAEKNFTEDKKGSLKKRAKIVGIGIMFTFASILPSMAQNNVDNNVGGGKAETGFVFSSEEVRDYIKFVKNNFVNSSDPEKKALGREMLEGEKRFDAFRAYKEAKDNVSSKDDASKQAKFEEVRQGAKIKTDDYTIMYSIGDKGLAAYGVEGSFYYDPSLKSATFAIEEDGKKMFKNYKYKHENVEVVKKREDSDLKDISIQDMIYKDLKEREANGETLIEGSKKFMEKHEEKVKALGLAHAKDGNLTRVEGQGIYLAKNMSNQGY